MNHGANKAWVGSCNGCTNGAYRLTIGTNEPVVTEVHLRGLSFRLCEACRVLVKAQL